MAAVLKAAPVGPFQAQNRALRNATTSVDPTLDPTFLNIGKACGGHRHGTETRSPPPNSFAPCDCRGHLQPGYARAERHLRHPDVGPVQGRNPLGLRFLRRFRLARAVEGDRLANERLEGGLVDFFSFVDVDRAACVSVETRVEE